MQKPDSCSIQASAEFDQSKDQAGCTVCCSIAHTTKECPIALVSEAELNKTNNYRTPETNQYHRGLEFEEVTS